MEFSDDVFILQKVYPDDCEVGGLNRRLFIMIKYEKNTFPANDIRQKVWTLDEYGILRPKRKEKGIMMSDFLSPWSQLNLLSLFYQQQEKLVNSRVPLEAATYFEYRKMEEGYRT